MINDVDSTSRRHTTSSTINEVWWRSSSDPSISSPSTC